MYVRMCVTYLHRFVFFYRERDEAQANVRTGPECRVDTGKDRVRVRGGGHEGGRDEARLEVTEGMFEHSGTPLSETVDSRRLYLPSSGRTPVRAPPPWRRRSRA